MPDRNSLARANAILAVSLVVAMITFPFARAVSPSSNAHPRSTYARASFVPPAAPSVVSGPQSFKDHIAYPSSFHKQIVTGYGTYSAGASPKSPPTALFSKKKGGVSPVSTKKGKMQVQLLQTVPDVGQKGDIVYVSPGVFQNQLKRNNLAKLISDEEVEKIEQAKEEKEEEMKEMALKTKSMLEEAMLANLGGEQQCDEVNKDICGVALEMKKKAGPSGNLFGGVSAKMIMDALKENYSEGSWDGKQVKVVEMKDLEGMDVPKMDIKSLGDYKVTVALGYGIEVLFVLSILEE